MNTSIFEKQMTARQAAGLVGGAVFASAAAIEVARAWTSSGRLPSGTGEVSQVLSGALVAMFTLSAFTLCARVKALVPACIVAFYALIAHGSALVLSGEVIGAVYLGIVPLVIALASVTMGPPWRSPHYLLSPARPVRAPAAARAASPNLSTTLA